MSPIRDSSVGAQGLSGVEIEMTNRGQQVSGTVTDAKGEAVTDYTVLVFSQDRARWTLPMNRYLRRLDAPDGRRHVQGHVAAARRVLRDCAWTVWT